MARTIEDARQNMCSWIGSIFPARKVLLAEFSTGQPIDPYFIIKIIYAKWYPHSRSEIVADETEVVKGNAKLHFSIQAIAGNEGGNFDPQANLHKLSNSFETIKSEIFFTEKEMGYCGLTANIEEISSVQGQRWEPRAAMTAMFDAIIEDSFTPEWADSTEITLIAKNAIDQHIEKIVVPTENNCS